jgi:hypothetical protein
MMSILDDPILRQRKSYGKRRGLHKDRAFKVAGIFAYQLTGLLETGNSYPSDLIAVKESPSIVVTVLMEVSRTIKISNHPGLIIHPVSQQMFAIHFADPGHLFAFLATQALLLPSLRSSILPPVSILTTHARGFRQSNRIAN